VPGLDAHVPPAVSGQRDAAAASGQDGTQ
jgi:hypothetical protein